MIKKLGFLAIVIIIYLSSVIYRDRVTPVFTSFPLGDAPLNTENEPVLYLYLFFSKNSCPPCLNKVIDILNQPREDISVMGIIPEKDSALIDDIRSTLGINFPIRTMKRWKRYVPNYYPTLYGVGRNGRIYIVLPCVGLEDEFLCKYLSEFQRKSGYLLLSK